MTKDISSFSNTGMNYIKIIIITEIDNHDNNSDFTMIMTRQQLLVYITFLTKLNSPKKNKAYFTQGNNISYSY